ncbi:EamA/RhaT family transporter [Siculibacillus lacustris]|uniref:EamA/RhaT family transporter n=1 Tax=Siculibacillus lacustris TaxID=1549641 RepID=A0A4Q9VKK7_9HYPH|nr:DMT family transporter [Siculibacillus lacustris]TBW35960.1 EamA/RhaT family transporter [Siculibacillus lacustris]
MFASLWIVTTIVAAGAQSLRNALQRSLTVTLGTIGATHVRFLFGLPFALLFLAGVLVVTGERPVPSLAFWGWAGLGGVGQIAATACMLHAMRDRSFLVTIAYTKTEPVQVALFGLAFLGEVPSVIAMVSIAVATTGVMILSWPRGGGAGGGLLARSDGGEPAGWGAAVLGITAGGFFGLSAVFFKGAIRAAGTEHFVAAATTALAASLAIQTLVLTLWLLARDRAVLWAIAKAWRPSVGAGFLGAFASQMWFLGFALAPVAAVRTLGLIEILYAQVLSRGMLKERPTARELFGIALLIAGVIGVLQG